MKIDVGLTRRILRVFAESDSVYLPVAVIARQVEDKKQESEEETAEEPDPLGISARLVFHLLHLQDLGCIENVEGNCSWGYVPCCGLEEDQVRDRIHSSVKNGEFSVPDCYNADTREAIIRLTATGIQLRDALDSTVSEVLKTSFLTFGKAAMVAGINHIIGIE